MPATSGMNDAATAAAITNIIDTDATVRLMVSAVNYDDTSSSLSTKELSAGGYSSVTVAQADWTISHNVGNRNASLANDNEVNFGTATEDWGTIEDVVVHGAGDLFLVCDLSTAPTIATDEEAFIPAGTTVYELGNPQ